MFLHDRAQDAGGEWVTNKIDVTMTQPAFAVDFGRLEVGWAHFAAGVAPQWSMVYYGQSLPAKPSSPGKDDKGKDMSYRSAFRVVVVGKQVGGMRELAGNSGAIINGMNELHTQYECAPEAAQGKIPLVKMTNVLEVKAGQSSNFQPVFAIQSWVDRPELLGPRHVAPPGATQASHATSHSASPSNHVPPPQAASAPPSDMPF